MWLMTTRGFYSAVQHRDDPGLIMVRARRRDDLERLLELADAACPVCGAEGDDQSCIEDDQLVDDHAERGGPVIVATPTADYPYRVTLASLVWDRLLVELSREIDYPNFKNAVTDRIGHAHHDAYMAVWSVMHRLQEAGAKALAHHAPARLFDADGWFGRALREGGRPRCEDCGCILLADEVDSGVCPDCWDDRAGVPAA